MLNVFLRGVMYVGFGLLIFIFGVFIYEETHPHFGWPRWFYKLSMAACLVCFLCYLTTIGVWS